MIVLGSELSPAARADVLRRFIYRWTFDNKDRTRVYSCDKCDIRNPYINTTSADGHQHPTIPLIYDADWLKDHAFHVKKDGSLDERRKHAEPACLANYSVGAQGRPITWK